MDFKEFHFKKWSTLFCVMLLSCLGIALAVPSTAQAVATIKTDQPEYSIGDFVIITGTGFSGGDTVTIQVLRNDGVTDSTQVNALADGTFRYDYYLNPNIDNPELAYGIGPDPANPDPLDAIAYVNGSPAASTTFLDNPSYNLQGCSKRESGDCKERSSSNGWSNGMDGWLQGELKGWYEQENVPYRLRVNLMKSSDGGKAYTITTRHDYQQQGSSVIGIDYAGGFYVGAGPSSVYPEGYLTKSCVTLSSGSLPTADSTHPCYVLGPTYATSGTKTKIQYKWSVYFKSDEAGGSNKRWALYWKAHVASGAAGFPGASLHSDTDASGSQDVPIYPVSATSSADLSIAKSGSPNPVSAGGTLTYSLTVHNNGPDSASNIKVTDTLPAGTTFAGASGTYWSCSYNNGSGVVTCTRSNSLGANRDAPTITIVVTAPSTSQTIVNNASVAWYYDGAYLNQGNESTLTNNATSVSTTVVVPAPKTDLVITKTGAPDPVSAGGAVTYTIRVGNKGPDAAPSVTVTDTLPTGTNGVNYAGWSGAGWTCTDPPATVIACTMSNLAGGTSTSPVYAPDITLTVMAPIPSTPVTITNTATASGGSASDDTDSTSDTAVAETVVSGVSDLVIVKAESADPVLVNGALTYTLTVTNNGPSAATGVSVSDTLPAGVIYGSASGAGWTCGKSGGTVTCFQSNMPVGTAAPIGIAVTAPGSATTLSNTATVTAFELDTDTSSAGHQNTSTVTTTVAAAVDLSISATDAPNPVAAGGTLTYTLGLANAGPSAATGVTVTDVLPSGVGYLGAAGSGWSCGQSGGTVTCTLSTLASGASANNIAITVTAPAAGAALVNTATVSANETDTNGGNNVVSSSTPVTAAANLSIAKTATATVTATGLIAYTLGVSNAGPSAASSLTVTDNLPAGTTYVSSGGTNWSCGHAAGTVTCTLSSLAANASANNITITVTAPAEGGVIGNTASVASQTDDPNSANNTASAGTNVTASSDLSIAKTAAASVTAGQNLTYTLTVTNNGPSTASGVSVADTLPGTATYVGASGSGWTCTKSGGTVTCTTASLAVGTAAPIYVTVTAPASGGGISNSASVSSSTGDPNGVNNSATVSTTVTTSSDLSITKTAAASVTAGQNLAYTLTVTNNGPSAASSVMVADTLPANASYVSASGTGWSCSQTSGLVTCTVGSLAAGTAPAIALTVKAPSEGGTLDNTATVSTTTSDPNGGNNSASASTTVTPSSDLSITKTAAASVETGLPLTYTLTVANNGPSTATGVSVTDTLPLTVTFAGAVGSGWNCTQAGVFVTCARPSLAVGTAPVITITVTAPSTTGSISNTASVSWEGSDPNSANDASTATTTVTNATSDLSVSKAASAATVETGRSLTYSVTVTNNGPNTATDVLVTDPLPSGVVFVGASGTNWNCSENAGQVSCSMPSMGVGTAPVIGIVTNVVGSARTIDNTATVSWSGSDPNSTNNGSTASTTVTVSEVAVSGAPSGDQRYPWVDFNETTGEYLAVWQDKRNGVNDDIYGVRLDHYGSRIGSDFAISLNPGHQQRAVVKSGGGGYLVVWQELKDYATNGADVYGVWVAGDGTVGPEMALCACPGDQWLPRVGYDPVSNTFLVSFLYWTGGSFGFDLWGAVVPAGGTGSVSPFAMVTAPGDQRGPQLGYDYENGRYYMAWNDRRGGTDYDIYGSRVSASGTLMDGTGVLLGGATGNQFRPTVVDRRPSAGIADHLVAWNDYRPGSEADVYGVYIDGAGAVVGSEIPVSLASGDSVHVVADVDWIRTKQNLVGWVDNRNGSDYDVYRSQVAQDGTSQGDVGVAGSVKGAGGQQQGQVVSYATDGINDYGFLMVWMDNRNGTDYDIRGIKVWP